MAKNLKLTGLKTYTNGVMNGVCVKKGEVVCFDDKVATVALSGKRVNAEHEDVPYFVETDEPATLDFSTLDTSKSEEAHTTPEALVIASAASQRQPARRNATK